jgi:hypothetical protein
VNTDDQYKKAGLAQCPSRRNANLSGQQRTTQAGLIIIYERLLLAQNSN